MPDLSDQTFNQFLSAQSSQNQQIQNMMNQSLAINQQLAMTINQINSTLFGLSASINRMSATPQLQMPQPSPMMVAPPPMMGGMNQPPVFPQTPPVPNQLAQPANISPASMASGQAQMAVSSAIEMANMSFSQNAMPTFQNAQHMAMNTYQQQVNPAFRNANMLAQQSSQQMMSMATAAAPQISAAGSAAGSFMGQVFGAPERLVHTQGVNFNQHGIPSLTTQGGLSNSAIMAGGIGITAIESQQGYTPEYAEAARRNLGRRVGNIVNPLGIARGGGSIGASLIGGGIGTVFGGMPGGMIGSMIGSEAFDQTIGRVIKPFEEQAGQMQAYGDLHRGFFSKRQFTAGRRGGSASDEMEFGKDMFKFALRDLGLEQQDVYKITQGAMASDLITQTKDVKQFQISLKKLIQNTKETAKVMHMSFENSVEFMSDLRNMGFDVTGTKYTGEVNNIKAAAMTAGMSTAQMMNVMRDGAKSFQGTGFGMSRGAQYSQLGAALGRTGRRGGSISEEQFREVGGTSGIASLTNRMARQYMEGPMGVLMASQQMGGLPGGAAGDMSIGDQINQVGSVSQDPSQLLKLATQRGRSLRQLDPRQQQAVMLSNFRKLAEGLKAPGQEIDDVVSALIQNQMGISEDQANVWIKMSKELPKVLQEELRQLKHQRSLKIRDVAAEQRDIMGRMKRSFGRAIEPISGAAASMGAAAEDWTEQASRSLENWWIGTEETAIIGEDTSFEAQKQLYASSTVRKGSGRVLIAGDVQKTRKDITKRLTTSERSTLSQLADDFKNTTDPLERTSIAAKMSNIAFKGNASPTDVAGLGQMYKVDLLSVASQNAGNIKAMLIERGKNKAIGGVAGLVLGPFGPLLGMAIGGMKHVTGLRESDREEADAQVKRFQALTGITDANSAREMMRDTSESSSMVKRATELLAGVTDSAGADFAIDEIATMMLDTKDSKAKAALSSIKDKAMDSKKSLEGITVRSRSGATVTIKGSAGSDVRMAREYGQKSDKVESYYKALSQSTALSKSYNNMSQMLKEAGIEVEGLTGQSFDISNMPGTKGMADLLRGKVFTKGDVKALGDDAGKKSIMNRVLVAQELLRAAEGGGAEFGKELQGKKDILGKDLHGYLSKMAKDNIIDDKELGQIEGLMGPGFLGGLGSDSKAATSTETIDKNARSETANAVIGNFGKQVTLLAGIVEKVTVMIDKMPNK